MPDTTTQEQGAWRGEHGAQSTVQIRTTLTLSEHTLLVRTIRQRAYDLRLLANRSQDPALIREALDSADLLEARADELANTERSPITASDLIALPHLVWVEGNGFSSKYTYEGPDAGERAHAEAMRLATENFGVTVTVAVRVRQLGWLTRRKEKQPHA